MENEEFMYVEAKPWKSERGRAALKRQKKRVRRRRIRVGIIIAAFVLGIGAGLLASAANKEIKKNDSEKSSGGYYASAHAQGSNAAADNVPVKTAGKAESSVSLNGKRILLDPGHGFADPGTSSDFLGCAEKEMTLLMAGLLKEELESRGYYVQLTHDGKSFPEENEIMKAADARKLKYSSSNFISNDVFSAYERTIYANVLNADGKFDMFLSLHVNAVESGNASGFQLDYCAENDYSEKSEELSKALEASLNAAFPDTQMKYRGDTFADAFIVTKYSRMPSMLLEMGYCTNETDAANMNDSGWRKKFVKAVADGIDKGVFKI